MGDRFDPKEEAKTVEHLGYNLLHGFTGDTQPWANHFAALNPQQVSELGQQLKIDNWKPNSLPTVDMQTDSGGHIVGFSFQPSVFDSSADSSFVSIGVSNDQTDE